MSGDYHAPMTRGHMRAQYPLPHGQDPWDSVVPEFYRDGLRDFNVEESSEDGDRVMTGASRWVSRQVERLVSALRGAGLYQVP